MSEPTQEAAWSTTKERGSLGTTHPSITGLLKLMKSHTRMEKKMCSREASFLWNTILWEDRCRSRTLHVHKIHCLSKEHHIGREEHIHSSSGACVSPAHLWCASFVHKPFAQSNSQIDSPDPCVSGQRTPPLNICFSMSGAERVLFWRSRPNEIQSS